MKIRIFAAFICMCLLCPIGSTQAIAATFSQDGIQPFWTSTESVALTLSYSGGKAHWSGAIRGKIGTTKISALFTLEKKNSNGTYTALKTWTGSSNSDLLVTSGSYNVSSGGTYRILVVATVTPKKGLPEEVKDSMEKTN